MMTMFLLDAAITNFQLPRGPSFWKSLVLKQTETVSEYLRK